MAGQITRRPSGQKGVTARRPARRGYADRLREGLGVLLAVGALYLVLCLYTYAPTDPSLNHAAPDMVIQNLGGRLGAYTADTLIMLFGLGAFLWVGWLVYHAVNMLLHREGPSFNLQAVTVPLLLVSCGVVLSLTSPLPQWPVGGEGFGNGGLLGKLVATLTVPLLGHVGALMLMGALAVLALLWFTGWSLREVHATAIWAYKVCKVFATMTLRLVQRLKFEVPEQFDLPLSHPIPRRPGAKVIRTEEDVEEAVKPIRKAPKQTEMDLSVPGQFALPTLELLDEPRAQKEGESEEALQQNARRIESELKNFGIEGTVGNIRPGPVITIYELEPAAGVKTSAIVSLQDDLARAMSALSIRIAPIPGRNVLGIELPNRERQFTSLRELLETEAFEEDPGALTVALGVDTSGQPTYTDIAKMPHGLIAGTTGSGKSVGINAFILSLLYRLTPDELKLVLVDPKMLELSIYNDIPHLLTPVITDPNKAAAALNWVVKEMENRYRLMAELGVKNLSSFNSKFAELQADGKIPTRLVQTGFDLQTGQPVHEEQPIATRPLPYIVVVIDELADLMMVAGKAVEFSIARLTQMARASGIHLLVATQRPSVDVVTGLIKANIPCRISFSVASKIDSRTVLDSMGAETLLGKGDMLYLGNGSNAMQRLHGAFVSEEECNRVAQHLRDQGQPSYLEDIFKSGPAAVPGSKGAAASGEDGDEGNLYEQAVRIVTEEGKASTSFLQRQLKIGYNRAADLIDKMEAEGVIGAPNHVGKREVIGKKAA
jgi:S-DNA-T family DNA segregation ATPase FtsK/SpoIIIE